MAVEREKSPALILSSPASLGSYSVLWRFNTGAMHSLVFATINIRSMGRGRRGSHGGTVTRTLAMGCYWSSFLPRASTWLLTRPTLQDGCLKGRGICNTVCLYSSFPLLVTSYSCCQVDSGSALPHVSCHPS